MGPGVGRAVLVVLVVLVVLLVLALALALALVLPLPSSSSSSSWGWALAVVLVLALALVLALVLRPWGSPLRVLRAPEEVGYLPEAGWSQAQAARRARRGRRLGSPMPPRFPNGWFCLLQSDALRPGEARSMAALGEQFAVFRDWDGRAHVVDAYCPHLGANLAIGGRVVGSCIECPFHGWQFHGEDGRCTRIPYAEKVPTFAKVKVWPSCEVGGMIVVWYHCDGIGPTWQVPEHEEILSHEWVFRGITEHYVSAHIEEIPENAADVAHLAFVHGPSILSGTDLRFINSQLWTFFKHHWQAEWQPEPEPEAHCSRLLVKHHVTVFGKRFSLVDLVISVRQVGPGLVFMVFEHRFLGRGVIIQSVTPVEPLLQQVVHRIYYQRNIPALVPKFILWAESVQFERDVMIWNNKKYLSKPLLVKEDGPIQRHRRWYAQFYGKDGMRASSPRPSLDW